MTEELDIELEALRATYDDALIISSQQPLSLSIALAPRDCPALPVTAAEVPAPHTSSATIGTGGSGSFLAAAEQEARCFVRATVVLHPRASYPETSPQIELESVRGLGDEREAALKLRLQTEAASLVGDMVLGHLCQTAQDVLTEMNHPEGACAICLHLFQSGEGTAARDISNEEDAALKLPCYHCYHLRCFGRWWEWQQEDAEERVTRIRTEHRLGAHLELSKVGLDPDARGFYTVLCPACRAPVTAAAVAASLWSLGLWREGIDSDEGGGVGLRSVPGGKERRRGDALSSNGKSSSASAAEHELSGGTWLAAEDMARLRLSQRRWAASLQAQQQRGGVIGDSGWGVSLDDLQQQHQHKQRSQTQSPTLPTDTPPVRNLARSRGPQPAAQKSTLPSPAPPGDPAGSPPGSRACNQETSTPPTSASSHPPASLQRPTQNGDKPGSQLRTDPSVVAPALASHISGGRFSGRGRGSSRGGRVRGSWRGRGRNGVVPDAPPPSRKQQEAILRFKEGIATAEASLPKKGKM